MNSSALERWVIPYSSETPTILLINGKSDEREGTSRTEGPWWHFLLVDFFLGWMVGLYTTQHPYCLLNQNTQTSWKCFLTISKGQKRFFWRTVPFDDGSDVCVPYFCNVCLFFLIDCLQSIKRYKNKVNLLSILFLNLNLPVKINTSHISFIYNIFSCNGISSTLRCQIFVLNTSILHIKVLNERFNIKPN